MHINECKLNFRGRVAVPDLFERIKALDYSLGQEMEPGGARQCRWTVCMIDGEYAPERVVSGGNVVLFTQNL